MVDAPDRIWIIKEDVAASWPGSFRRFLGSDLNHGENGTEYVRADIAASQIAEVRANDCDPDGCKAHIDAFMDRALAAEAKADRLAAEVERLEVALRLPDADRRLWFISGLLARNGHFNRRDICEAFNVSIPQASLDIKRWLAAHPCAATYNPRSKRYEIAALASVKE